jgi:hypothetical protein
VLEIQRTDFTEPSDSLWVAQVIMAPKKGGELRFCVDYRRLNEVTRKDSYPIPRIEVSLDLVWGVLLVLLTRPPQWLLAGATPQRPEPKLHSPLTKDTGSSRSCASACAALQILLSV